MALLVQKKHKKNNKIMFYRDYSLKTCPINEKSWFNEIIFYRDYNLKTCPINEKS